MGKNSFLLVSLEEKEAKHLAQVISNDTCRKILDYLANHELATETQIAKDLDIALSTVHYNMGHLVEAQLVSDEHYTYSKKGKEIKHYMLSNTYVVIAPKKSKGLREKLKSILPALVGISIGAALIKWLTPLQQVTPPMAKSARAFAESADMAQMVAAEAAPTITQSTQQIVHTLHPAWWFLLGGAIAMIVIVITMFVLNRTE